MQLLLYMRPHCSLCEEAKQLLTMIQRDVSFTFQEVNIEQNDALHEQWLLRIPVIVHENDVLEEGLIDYMLLEQNIMNIIRKRDNEREWIIE